MSQKYDISKGKHFPLVMTAFVLKDQKHIHSWLIMMLWLVEVCVMVAYGAIVVLEVLWNLGG